MHVAVIVPRTAFLHPLDDVGPLHWRVGVPHAFWVDGGRNALMPGDFFRVTYAPAEDFVIDVEPAAGLPSCWLETSPICGEVSACWRTDSPVRRPSADERAGFAEGAVQADAARSRR